MKNVRIEDGAICYDCDGVGCPSPGEPHRVSLSEFFAGLEATMKEFVVQEDPRAEVVDLALQFVYEAVYGKKDASCPLGKAAPWHEELKRLILTLDDHYAAIEEKPAKELLN